MNEPHITLAGNLAFDPKIRFTPNRVPVLDLRIATTPRLRKGEDWEDGTTLWFDVVCWKQLAENVSNSLHKGDPVTVSGRLTQRNWKREDGSEATTLTVEATHVGADLGRFPVDVKRPERPRPEDHLGDRFVSRVTGELSDVGGPGLEPFAPEPQELPEEEAA